MNNFLFDTHSHLDLMKDFDSKVLEIERNKIYTIAVTNLPPLYKKLKNKLESKYIKPALGFHPELIEQYKKFIPQMWELLPEARYIGEVGLDYKVAVDSKPIQVDFFESLIERCNILGGKILTIHSRNSVEDVLSIIGEDFNGKFILHWYSGSLKNLDIALNNGAYFSINYAMLNSKNGLNIINKIPEERLLTESDMPFVILKNKNIFTTLEINLIVEKLAFVKNKKHHEMLQILNKNFRVILSEN